MSRSLRSVLPRPMVRAMPARRRPWRLANTCSCKACLRAAALRVDSEEGDIQKNTKGPGVVAAAPVRHETGPG